MPTKGMPASAASRMSAWEIADEKRVRRRDGAGLQESPHVDVLGRLARGAVNRGEERREAQALKLPLGLLLGHPRYHGDEPLRRLALDEALDAGEEADRRVDGVDVVEKRAENPLARVLIERLSDQILVDAVEDQFPAAPGVAPEAVGDAGTILGVGREGIGQGLRLGPHAVGDDAVVVEKQHLDGHGSRSAPAV